MRFDELSLKPSVLRALKDMGYEELTPIQEQTFPHVLAGRDLLALAETGSGKTGACAVPIVQMTDPALDAIQALILVPTRELAQQYVSEISQVAQHTDLAPFSMFGGFPMDVQKAKLKHGVHILVATPGRLIDFLYNTPLSLGEVRTFVLDEADEMLKMGFIDDVDFVMSCLVHEHQTLLFGATMPPEVDRLVDGRLVDPLRIRLNVDQIAPQSLVHCFKLTGHRERYETLCTYLRSEEVRQAIIFCNSRIGSEKLWKQLAGDRFKSAEIIHGGLPQGKRTSIFDRFRRKDIKLMVSTDLAGRGLDFSHVSHVINYDFPRDGLTYTHRTGRAARMGRSGTAFSMVTSRDVGAVAALVRRNRIEPVWDGPPPSDKDGRGGSQRRGPRRYGDGGRRGNSRRR